MDDDAATCDRCTRTVSIDDDDFLAGEATSDGNGWICEDCLTPEEQDAMIEDCTALDEALHAAGLAGNVDLESMDDGEYEMREDVADLIYRHDPRSGADGGTES